MSAPVRSYRVLLRAYPAEFREAYGHEMELVFRSRWREAQVGRLRFWVEMLWDLGRSAPRMHLERSRRRSGRHTRTEEAEMMGMTILAILIGAREAVNALQEVWLGGMMEGEGYPLMGGTMGVVAGMLLVSAGIALLRRAPGASSLARGAAITCLLVFLLIGLMKPLASYAATILGIGFPLTLLLFLRRRERCGPSSEPGVA